jgi:RNA-directed DNA polymerase
MSRHRGGTPRLLAAPVAQRHLKAEVATCVGGVLSPLIFNVAMSALDEHLHRPWKPGGTMETSAQRARRRAKGLPNWRVCRYADDLVVLVHGTQADAETLREEIAHVLVPLGLRLSKAKTRVVHMSEAFDFLGFRIQWKRKRGTDKWHVYTFIANRPIRSLKAKCLFLNPV